MERLSQVALIHGSSSEVVHCNPNEHVHHAENVNDNQRRQYIHKGHFNEPPPSYIAALQSSPNSALIQHYKPEFENTIPDTPPYDQQARYTYIHAKPRHSINVVCPNCHATVNTHVETSSTLITIVMALILCFFCICLACVPFCISACKKTIHYCPNCNSQLIKIREFQ